MSKKIRRYFRKLSQQFSCNEGCLLILLSLYFFFFLDCFSTSVGLEDLCPKGSHKVREIQNIHQEKAKCASEGGGWSWSQCYKGTWNFILHGNHEGIRAISNSM